VLVAAGSSRVKVAVCRHGLVHVWGTGALGTAAAPESSDVPVPLAASVFPGARCGRGGGLSRQQMVVFAQGAHARLGADCVSTKAWWAMRLLALRRRAGSSTSLTSTCTRGCAGFWP